MELSTPTVTDQTLFRLPVVGSLNDLLTQVPGNEVSCSVPIARGAFQVGFSGIVEEIGKITARADVDSGTFSIDLGSAARQVEGPSVVPGGSKGRIVRHATPPIQSMQFTKAEDGWLGLILGNDNQPIALGRDDKLVLLRTVAKLGDIASKKITNRSHR